MLPDSVFYSTKDGRLARVYAKDGYGDFPLHGAILNDYGWEPYTWTINGSLKLSAQSDADLLRSLSKDEVAKAVESHKNGDSYSLPKGILDEE